MGSKRQKSKLTVVDVVKDRPRHGASAKEIDLYDRLRVYKNRNAELEEALAARARGNVGQTLVVVVTAQMLDMLTLLTQSGLYGATSEGTAHQLLQQALRDPRAHDLADAERWRAMRAVRWSRPRRRLRRRPRRPVGKNGKLKR